MQRFLLSFTIAIAALSFCNHSFAEDLEFLRPLPEQPMYQLSNLRTKGSIQGEILLFDFKRTRKGTATVYLEGRSSRGTLSFRLSSSEFNKDSGTISIKTEVAFINQLGSNYELWLETEIRLIKGRRSCKLSNTIGRGSVSGSIRTRPITEKEIAGIKEYAIFITPPASLPENMLEVTSSTNLLPGMPIQVGYKGNWEDAEVIQLRERGNVLIKFKNIDYDLVVKARSKWLAIAPAVLEQASTTPNSFTPSVRVLGKGTIPIPADTQPVPESTKLVLGTPIFANSFSKWADGHIVEILSTQKFKIKVTNWGSAFEVSREELLLNSATIQELTQPQIEEKYAKNLIAVEKEMLKSASFGKRLEDWPIKIPVPKDCKIVTQDMILEIETPLAVCHFGKWNLVFVKEIRDDGLLLVETGKRGFLNGYVEREQVIIQVKTLRILQAKQKEEEYFSLRNWADSTGSYKIPATYVSSTSSQVTLMREDGKILTLAILKLCVEDQRIIKSLLNITNPKIPNHPANPFANQVASGNATDSNPTAPNMQPESPKSGGFTLPSTSSEKSSNKTSNPTGSTKTSTSSRGFTKPSHTPTKDAPASDSDNKIKPSLKVESHEIDLRMPSDSLVITKAMPIRVGTKIQACWGSKWYDLTVLQVTENGGPLYIAWDGWSDSWNTYIQRNQLIIKKSSLQSLPIK